jgi:hypothetical protein
MADYSPYTGIGWNPPTSTTTGINFNSGLPSINTGNTGTSNVGVSNPSYGYNSGLVLPVANYTGVLPWSGSAALGAPRTGHTHQGIDMKAYEGQPLVAVIDGTIKSVHSNASGGLIIHLLGTDGRTYKYMHLSKFAVSTGQKVTQGQVIGYAGSTGNASGPHLHFEVWGADGKVLNPSAVLSNTQSVSGNYAVTGDGTSGGSGASFTAADREAFFDYMGRYPTSSEQSRMVSEGWDQNVLRRYAVQSGGTGPEMQALRNQIKQIGAGFYNGDPSQVPDSVINALISGGYSLSYIRDTYFPMLRGGSLTNPSSQKFVDAWVDMTGRPPTYTATVKLNEIIKTYGYSPEAEAAWVSWVKTTDSAATGNWGAEHRAVINDTISQILGRSATEAELAKGNTYWDLNEAALLERVRATPEYQAIYSGKPAWMDEGAWIDAALGFNDVFRWYYGDRVGVNPDGSLTIPTGEFYQAPTQTPASTGVSQFTPLEPPQWKSLNNTQWAADLKGYGITFADGKYTMNGQEISADDVLSYLPENTYYRDSSGFHYVQEEGAIDPRTGQATTGPTVPRTTGVYDNTTTQSGGLNNFGVSYVNNDMLGSLVGGGYTPAQLRQEFIWQEEASYMQGIYSDVLTEAFGGSGGIDWYKMASGAKGSGAMRAQLVEAQNRVAYRETYRQIFGTDPDPSDYDRITQQFVSPGEMLREHQAIESADEMYEETNDLLMRVYGQGVSKNELKDMVLGRPNSGELKALINQATKLDAYTWIHKQYYDTAPTPEDYARYAGFTGPAELQWEIVTHEKVNEMRETVNEALVKAGYDPFTDEELTTMYGEQEGYGDLLSIYRKASKKATEVDQAEDWQYNGAEQVDVGYTRTNFGTFKVAGTGLADL